MRDDIPRSLDEPEIAGEKLPFPDKDISPALQRTLKQKFDQGENDMIPRKDWDRAMRLVGRSGEES